MPHARAMFSRIASRYGDSFGACAAMTQSISRISKQLCEQFHFQEDYFNRLLRQKTGMTYTEYVQKLRLDEAERLLTSTSLSIEQIADAVGYQNKGYFYRIFTERYQMTPARFRKEHTGA